MAIYDVIGFGAVAVDDLYYVDHYPSPEEKLHYTSYVRQGGGLAGTALVTAARMGVNAAYCGSLGEDVYSKYVLSEFEKEGVSTTLIDRTNQAAPIHSLIIVDESNGKRVVINRGSGLSAPAIERISEELITSSKFIFVDHTVMQASIFASKLAKRCQVPVVADIERDEDTQIPELLQMIDHLIINLRMAQKAPAALILKMPYQLFFILECLHVSLLRVSWAVITRPGRREYHIFPRLKVPVVDTTGCGDVFHGAYIASLVLGYSIDDAIMIATATAGMKAAHPGGRAGIPQLQQVKEFLTTKGFDI